MPVNISYEIYSFKNGDWMLDSVHDDKNMAIHQGRMLIASPHHMAIRVVEESYNDTSDQSVSRIIYKEQKGGDEEKPKKRPVKKKKGSSGLAGKKRKKKKKKKDKSKTLIMLVLSLGGIGLGLLALVAVMLAKYG